MPCCGIALQIDPSLISRRDTAARKLFAKGSSDWRSLERLIGLAMYSSIYNCRSKDAQRSRGCASLKADAASVYEGLAKAATKLEASSHYHLTA